MIIGEYHQVTVSEPESGFQQVSQAAHIVDATVQGVASTSASQACQQYADDLQAKRFCRRSVPVAAANQQCPLAT